MRLQYLVGGCVSRERIGRVVLTMVLVASLLPARMTAAANSNLTSDQVAAEILRTQAKADETAQRWSQAQIHLEDVAAEIQTSQAKIAAASAQYSDLQAGLARIAIDRFTGGAAPSILLVNGDLTAALQINVLKNLALDAGSADLDTLDAVRSDLESEQAHLDTLNTENAQLVADLATRQTDINAQLADLATLREQLKNAEVKRAYEAQLAKQRQDEANATAERDAKAAADQVARAAAAASVSPPVQARGSGLKPTPPAPSSPTPTPSSPTPSSPTPAPSTEPPAPAPAPTPRPAPVITGGSWICPVAGPNAFGDTWGAPRPGGRTHQGVDMMSPFGTPLVAVVAGFATMRTNNLGGNTVSFSGDDGNGYYYAHLSSWEGSSRSVAAGEVIGYVGHTGDTTADHLHFEIHPAGGAAVNPYPTVRQYC
ncbi:MAG: peptidoglycan DD-metalloendopeptidase family protein [Ilumatobacteraceae bacterium]